MPLDAHAQMLHHFLARSKGLPLRVISSIDGLMDDWLGRSQILSEHAARIKVLIQIPIKDDRDRRAAYQMRAYPFGALFIFQT